MMQMKTVGIERGDEMKIDSEIPYNLIKETTKEDKYGLLTITRIYEIPKPPLFKSPNIYLGAFEKLCGAEWEENGMKIKCFCGGWADAKCRSYELYFLAMPI